MVEDAGPAPDAEWRLTSIPAGPSRAAGRHGGKLWLRIASDYPEEWDPTARADNLPEPVKSG